MKKIDNFVLESIASSFVYSKLKIKGDKGSGEAKLYLGPVKNENEFLDFFNNFDDSNIYYF